MLSLPYKIKKLEEIKVGEIDDILADIVFIFSSGEEFIDVDDLTLARVELAFRGFVETELEEVRKKVTDPKVCGEMFLYKIGKLGATKERQHEFVLKLLAQKDPQRMQQIQAEDPALAKFAAEWTIATIEKDKSTGGPTSSTIDDFIKAYENSRLSNASSGF